MLTKIYYVGFKTILHKEIKRFLRVWAQSLLPPVISSLLYFVIFGTFIGQRVGTMSGISYIQYIAPGMIMMWIITNSFVNVVFSFYISRFERSIEQLLVSPLPNYLILLGYISGGVARGICVGFVVTLTALLFTHLEIHHLGLLITIIIFSAALFSLAGFINAIFAKTFDHTSIIPTFVLTPLTYLGGVFYSVNALPSFWRELSFLNPVLYIINIFRYSMLGVTDVSISVALTIVIIITCALFAIALILLNKGIGIRA